MRILAPLVATLAIVCGTALATEPDATGKVVFVCEHGNVKSLMAAAYFNQLAAQRGLHLRAVARAVVPDSTTVPTPIAAGLHEDGVDVGGFHPSKIAAADVAEAVQVVTISTELPPEVKVDAQRVESWSDVPAASVNYDAARTSLKAHVAALLDRLGAH